jgi:hypothetical protein
MGGDKKLVEFWAKHQKRGHLLIRPTDAASLLRVSRVYLMRLMDKREVKSIKSPSGVRYCFLDEILEISQWPIRHDKIPK